jgi:hypothetical protein
MYFLVFHAYFLLVISVFKGLTARRLYKSFGVKGLIIYECLFDIGLTLVSVEM